MPIYEYTCRKCQAHVEILQKMTDKPLTRCKKCGGKLEKQWSQTGFQFKGTGWYVTDYAGKQADKKEAEPKGEAKPETKTETKAEPKAEAKSASKTGGETKPAATAKTSNSAAKGD
ncbi:MAG TPA: zinc ribbon domain-containing protein [Pyrinomonadaceae bacterium]|nr:zinc ribbon domain-containing protein [Pyrinomonadaceae bacterium]